MLGYEKEQRSLNKEQKQAVRLLSIGTFLEYFGLMFYVHMAVLLNNLFFPEYDPFTFSLLTAFSFCSTYLLRPIGALIFGYIGDHFGRKIVVVLTTLLMAITCVIIGSMPTYAQIGITASWVLTICRIIQGRCRAVFNRKFISSYTISISSNYNRIFCRRHNGSTRYCTNFY